MFNPFSALTSKIYGALAIGALVVAGAQTIRIEGALCRDNAAGVTSRPNAPLPEARYSRCLVTGFKQNVADRDVTIGKLSRAVADERDAHRETKRAYKQAQDEAAALERQRLAQVKAEQQEITDEVTADYRRRLADARARAEQLRGEGARAGEHPAGPSGAEPLPAAGDAAGGADVAPADRGLSLDERVVASEQAIQLDALISWVEQQLGVRVNGADRTDASLLEARP